MNQAPVSTVDLDDLNDLAHRVFDRHCTRNQPESDEAIRQAELALGLVRILRMVRPSAGDAPVLRIYRARLKRLTDA